MSDDVRRYPLEWPLGWKRTPAHARVNARFRSASERGVPMRLAVERLQSQLERLGVEHEHFTLSSNLRVRIDGTVKLNEGEPTDPGVATYFTFRGRATVFACDRYARVADNIAAIAAHIDALRRIERHGVGTIEQAMAGYRSLPADSAADWRSVFGFKSDDRVTRAMVESAFRQRASTAHPDKGGSDVAMAHVNRAREFAMREVSS